MARKNNISLCLFVIVTIKLCAARNRGSFLEDSIRKYGLQNTPKKWFAYIDAFLHKCIKRKSLQIRRESSDEILNSSTRVSNLNQFNTSFFAGHNYDANQSHLMFNSTEELHTRPCIHVYGHKNKVSEK